MAWTLAAPQDFRSFRVNSSVTAISKDSDGNYSSGGLALGTLVILDSTQGVVKAPTAAGTAAGGAAIGVVATDPAAGPNESVNVQIRGQAKCLSNAAITLNDLLMCAGTSGKVATATAATAEFIIGRALEAATAANQLITVELFGDVAGFTTAP